MGSADQQPGPGAAPAVTRLAWVPLAALGLMIAEFTAFVVVGYLIGFPWTMLLVLVASLAGLVLLRREGLRAWRRFREGATAGTPPGRHVTDGLVGLGGALLLAVPGLVSGVIGAALLLPPVRGMARGRVQARAERLMSAAEAGQVFGPRRVRVQPTTDPALDAEVVEGEIVDPGDHLR